MKKTAIILSIIVAATYVQAQCKIKVQSAYSSLSKGYLDKAKGFVDESSVCDDTKDWAKTWYYKGLTYLSIQISKEDKYKHLDSNALEVSYLSFQKAIELDTKKEYTSDILSGLVKCGAVYFDKGAVYYNTGKYIEAMACFDKTISINNTVGTIDTIVIYNAARSALNAKKYDKAKNYLLQEIKNNYHEPLIYEFLSNIYKNENDTANALKIIKKGRKTFPDNYILLIDETNFYLAYGRTKEAKDLLELAIKKDPNNANLYFAIGNSYESLSNDTSKSQVDRESYFNEAAKSYLKTVEIKPDFFDAIYSLGALYFNDGIRIYMEADKMTNDMDKYNVLKVKFEERWKQSLPYLEKAYQINPNDYNTLLSLKQLYARTNQKEKLAPILEKLKTVK